MADSNEDLSTTNGSDDTLERLRNITKMFSGKVNEDDEQQQQLQKVEKFAPSAKIKNAFQKFEEIGLSNGQYEEDEDQPLAPGSDDIVRSTRKKKASKEHIPYHEMSEVKDKFEKGLLDGNKPRVEKRLDVRVQSGLTSSKKQAFEQIENDINMAIKPIFIDCDGLAGVATEKKAKFENGQLSDRVIIATRPDEIANLVEIGLAQAKRSELLSKIDAEQQSQRSANRCIDIDAELGLATARRDQLASLANSEFKSTEKYIDVTAGLTSTIKEQYIADRSKTTTSKTIVPAVDVESGLTKSRATVFENLDETTVKRTVEIDNGLVERGVAKERVAMFKNLENGTQSSTPGVSGDSKIRVDRVEFSDTLIKMSVRLKIKSTVMDKNIADEENGNIVRESDKREEIYFEKGQTKQLVEQWKTKQISPERDTRDTEILQQGKAKNLVQMWKSMDKENTPPPERRGPRAITPPTDNERRISSPEDDVINSQKLNYTDDKANIEFGHAKAVRERLLQNAEQNNTVNTRKSQKQFTPPPPQSSDMIRRKSETPPNDTNGISEQYPIDEEFVPTKGQAKSLKNRFIELEQDARKVETSSSKIKYVPKRFVNTPAPKQTNADSTKCAECDKTVYAMEKIEADKKVYHKSCFKCMHCKSILKLGNFTANDGQIYCKPHFLQLFAMKGNYSAGFGLNDPKTRWLSSSSSSIVH